MMWCHWVGFLRHPVMLQLPVFFGIRVMTRGGLHGSSILYKSLGSTEELYDSDMTHSYRLTEGRLIRYPLIRPESVVSGLEDSAS